MNRRRFFQLLMGANIAPPSDMARLQSRVIRLEGIAVGLFREIMLTDFIANTRQAANDARLKRLESLVTDALIPDCDREQEA